MSSSLEGQSDLRSFLPKWKITPPDPMFKKYGAKVRYPKRYSTSTRPPPITSPVDTGRCGKETAWRTAETAITSYNQTNPGGLEYELVDAQNCILSRRKGLYHCNFTARLLKSNESDELAEEKLFFAEVKFLHHFDKDKKNPDGLKNIFCCILGPTATKTGENGCMSCKRQPGVIQHPEDGFEKIR